MPEIHTYVRTYIHACMHTYIHTYMFTYIHRDTNDDIRERERARARKNANAREKYAGEKRLHNTRVEQTLKQLRRDTDIIPESKTSIDCYGG